MAQQRIIRVRRWSADDEAEDDLFRLSETDFQYARRLAGEQGGVEQARRFIAIHGQKIEPDCTIELTAF